MSDRHDNDQFIRSDSGNTETISSPQSGHFFVTVDIFKKKMVGTFKMKFGKYPDIHDF